MVAIIVGVVIGSLILLPLANWAVWALIPPLQPHSLAKTGNFVLVGGIDTYYERHGSGPPLILIPAGGTHTSTWRFNVGALSRAHEVWTLDLPGSGYSDKPSTFPYTHRSYAEFVRDFMTTMGIHPMHWTIPWHRLRWRSRANYGKQVLRLMRNEPASQQSTWN